MLMILTVSGVDCGAHPGMDAALELRFLVLDDPRPRLGLPVLQEDIVCARRLRNQLSIHYPCALGPWNGIPRGCIEWRYEPPPNLATRVNVCFPVGFSRVLIPGYRVSGLSCS